MCSRYNRQDFKEGWMSPLRHIPAESLYNCPGILTAFFVCVACLSSPPLSLSLLQCVLLGVECLCLLWISNRVNRLCFSALCMLQFLTFQGCIKSLFFKCWNSQRPMGTRTKGFFFLILCKWYFVGWLLKSKKSVVMAVSSTVGWSLKLECHWLETIWSADLWDQVHYKRRSTTAACHRWSL